MKYDKFLEISHGQNSLSICRRANRGKDELQAFILDAPVEDLNLLMAGLAKIVDDPKKLDIRGDITEQVKDDALELALSIYEMINRRYNGQHSHAWHALIGAENIIHQSTDTVAGMAVSLYMGEFEDSSIPDDEDEDDNDDDNDDDDDDNDDDDNGDGDNCSLWSGVIKVTDNPSPWETKQ